MGGIGSYDDDFILREPSKEQLLWRHRGYLDCLRGLVEDGPPDPKFVEWLCLKTHQPFISLTYLEDLKRRLANE